MTIAQGTTLGHYEIRSLLGAGGMGEVYTAYDLTLRREVALKVLHADLLTDKERLRRFEREAYAASSLNHPNILSIYAIGHEADYQFMVTELVDGESLAQLLRHRRLRIDEVLEISMQIASALSAAHAAGIIHRDIKPDNIMLRRDQIVKVLDFGLAKLSEPESDGNESKVSPLTMSGMVMGTARYMSPEQARGLPVDGRTDLWSLGAVLYEMVSGHAPFTGKTMSDVLVAVLTTEPPDLSQFISQVPAELGRIVRKALCKQQEERYQLARDLEQDLKNLKHRVDFEAELERSGEAQRNNEAPTIVASPNRRAKGAALIDRPSQAYSEATDVDTPAKREREAATGSELRRETASEVFPLAGEPARLAHLTRLAQRNWKTLAGVAALAIIGVIAAGLYWRWHKSVKLTDKDTVVLAEFVNTTGDAIFDGTLRQSLASQLEQSPFLSLLSDDRVAQTLVLMEKPKDERLTHQLARDVCQRTGSNATIEGSISGLGSRYELLLKAVDCRSSEVLAEMRETVSGREQVIEALGKTATKMRDKLGESLASVQKYDVPAENVTTGSLEALQAYSQGYKIMNVESDWQGAIPFFEQAVSLDPSFAMAYTRLAVNYLNTGDGVKSAENALKAYDLRKRVSERERFYIESTYELYYTENAEAARKIDEEWMQIYPRDNLAPRNLGVVYAILGEREKTLPLLQESLRLDPGNGITYGNLANTYIQLNRLDEAKATVQEARARSLDYPSFHFIQYFIDFMQHDRAGMEHETALLMKTPSLVRSVTDFESQAAAYGGQMSRARELTGRVVDELQRTGKKDLAGGYLVHAALREALVGNLALAKREAEDALKLSDDKYTRALSWIVLALAGDSAKAARIADELASRFPQNTSMQFHYLPMLRAAIAIESGNQTKATEAFAAGRYELGIPKGVVYIGLYPVYMHGLACLAAHEGAPAAEQFEKILGHPGLAGIQSIGALAHLGLGRAYVLTGDTDKARTAYQDFFAIWKDADSDVPILKEAKAEYAKLKD